MDKITFVRLNNPLHKQFVFTMFFVVFGFASHFSAANTYDFTTPLGLDLENSYNSQSLTFDFQRTSLWNPLSFCYGSDDCDGDGVTTDQENIDGTDPNDPCDFVLAHQNCSPSYKWKKMDCDGDGVTNGREKHDGTDPLDPCDFVLAHQNCSPSYKWKKMDCDGDGVTNGREKEDGTDPLDPCDFVLEHQDCAPSQEWKKLDCDGDGVSNGQEKEDGTDPLDPCDFVLEHQDCAPSQEWKNLDCDGDGVTNGDEKEDGTDPLDPCEYNPDSVTLPQSGDYLDADCDGDGVTNGDEIEDGTDPLDSCDFKLESQTVTPDSTWIDADCDGDGVTNGDEKEDGTDPLDPCDYNPESVTLPQSANWESLDCDGDGNPNDTDPDPLTVNANDDFGSTPATIEVAINILENDDFLPNNAPNNVGVTNIERIGGSAVGVVVFNNDTGFVNYIPETSESNSTVSIVYQVCNILPDPSVCATATIYIEIGANALDAVDDTFTAETGDGGTIPNSNVLTNDTYNGEPVSLEDVVLTSTPTDQLTINADGTISVVPGTEAGTYTIEYTICDVADSANCDTATVTVEVLQGPGNVLDAVDDTFTAETGDGGTIPNSNVLTNDTYNGEPVSLEDVVLTSTPTDQLTINADGTINVVPGTEAGTYTIEYTICDVADSGNCDTATVTVEVLQGPGNVLDAVDDMFTAETGEGGTIPNSNVLTNDTYNGEPVSLEDVVLTSTPTDQLTINADGTINVVPGTEAGTYTIEYTICDVADSANCDTATVTVEVLQGPGNVLDAVDDMFTAETGEGGTIPNSNVLTNDTYNGEPVSLEDVVLTSTPTDQLTINADGTINVVPGTEAGTYTIEYTICDVMDVNNCDTATVTVEVLQGPGNVLDAVDDMFTAETGEGGTIPNSNVLSNDTYNGEPVSLADVVLTSTPTDQLTINADGTISVVPGTEAGTYTIEYTICDVMDVNNCDTATVAVEIIEGMENVIDAVDDTYNTGIGGGPIENSNVLDNDTLNDNPVSITDVILTSTPTNELSVEEDGSIRVFPGTPIGIYTIEYTICEAANGNNCDTAIVTVIVEEIEVNQMLTPNGDLKNDFLFIRGVEYIKSSTLKIFNRWGTQVFESANYDNVNNVFDGRVRGKSAISVNDYLPAGVYFYIFNYETAQGSFTDSEYIYISR
ncbi:gliding motility-associated C-terminal domain-containing protein [Flagellimonas sp. C4]|uniref:T9SS type B sorting domain-containing protein n=1 Tax=Flagellimonas alginolytica TaxID=3177515 RepID=UPI0035C88923